MTIEILDPRNERPEIFLTRSRALGLSDRNARRLTSAVLSRGQYSPQSWREAGLINRKTEEQLLPLPSLKLERVVTSAKDGFQKLLFRTNDELPVETVAIPLHRQGRVSICLSSQVGCVMGCAFCATARMSGRRSLQSWEIVEQFLQARQLVIQSGRKVTGAVFMGMGEPFLNYDRVITAARVMHYPVLNAISAKAITISTVGLIPQIDRFTDDNEPYRLSISLGAATDEKREKLVPVAAKTKVREVMAAARRYANARKERVMLAYVCIGGVNVFEEDAQALGELIGDTPVRLDLIDVNDPSGKFTAPSEDELKNFRNALRQAVGQPVVRRYSGGADIQAACGTLAGAA